MDIKDIKTLHTVSYNFPGATLHLGATDDGALIFAGWNGSAKHIRFVERLHLSGYRLTHDPDNRTLKAAVEQIGEYMRGTRTRFDLKLMLTGTAFQQRVWFELSTVGYSQRLTYAQLAAAIGRPKAVRAVANAVASNPISIFVPCHRIVSASGDIGNYDGGVEMKQLLLSLEDRYSHAAAIKMQQGEE